MIKNLKPLKFHSWHRGTRENDILLGKFADACLESLNDDDIRIYACFLNESDPDIFRWIMVEDDVPVHYQSLLQQIKQFHLKNGSQNKL